MSEAASERLRISLRASATRFRQDFNRELIRAYLNFHINSSAPPSDMTRYHLERLELWNKTAPYPQLISSVSMVDADEHGSPRLSCLNATAKRFELTEWSGEFVNLRDRFEQRFESGRLSPMPLRPLESFVEDIPALIVPLPSLSADKLRSQGSPPPQGFTIIKLDLNYLTRNFIPSLIQRNFVDDSHTEYNLAVTTLNHPERVIYSSGYPLTDFASSDVSTRIFGFGVDDIGAFLRSETAGSPAGAEQTGARQLRLLPINMRLLKGPAAGSSTPLREDGRWQLLIKHQAGSLAAAVSSARHRLEATELR